MLYTEEMVRSNVRNREGKRVFFLAKEDRLTPGARDWLSRERIEVLPAEQAKINRFRLENGAIMEEKPEHMTHLHGDVLVSKTHPRIRFRGVMDEVQAEILLCQLIVSRKLQERLGELLGCARRLIRCDVLDEAVPEEKLGGMTEQQLRERSHRPQDFYGQTHFMPEANDGREILELNRLRCVVRRAELVAVEAFVDEKGVPTRPDILKALNRMSSLVYILMIETKAGQQKRGE